MMHRNMIVLCMVMGVLACSEPQKTENKNAPLEKKQLTFGEMPNEQTKYETITTQALAGNDAALVALQTQLIKDQFEFNERDSGNSWSIHDCQNNMIIDVKGEGVSTYTAKSKIGVGEKGNDFPDFLLLTFEFPSIAETTAKFKILDDAVHSGGGFCNGKVPATVVMSGNMIFYFTTRSENFRDYIYRYAAIVQNLKNQPATEAQY
ncbi:hypothetical protein [Acinetobacter silvestris]|uniref:Uncharacterized protein n=1 Tax=Acinetobacter silvestris TaxID=1977882 RepID=A0A1Y3CFT9_9GAMM|nr:hypothetical protein [Acinetobacter silvestris]OTG64772.1 hypothetical protein B9T28_11235 [Acinetobacter silvestris]